MKVGDLVKNKAFKGVGLIVGSHFHNHGQFVLHLVLLPSYNISHTMNVVESQLEVVSESR
jgi:hypothetical protein